MRMLLNSSVCLAISLAMMSGCGGSSSDVSVGGGTGTGGGGEQNPAPAPAPNENSGTRHFRVDATVTGDTCGERINNVRQVFTLTPNTNGYIVNTGIVEVQAADIDGTIEGGFAENAGDCVREYRFSLANVFDTPATATFSSRSTCGGNICESTWSGSINEVPGRDGDFGEIESRVRGEACNPNIPSELRYRPSTFECNGNSSVLVSGFLRSNYSIVVRRNGQFNDRDPNNPSCETNRCSPYKTQKRLELPAYQVNCLGGSGFHPEYDPVKRISIKFVAKVTDANDTRQFEQYCLDNVEADLN